MMAKIYAYEYPERLPDAEIFVDIERETTLISDQRHSIIYDGQTSSRLIGREIKQRFASRLALAIWELESSG